MTEAEITVSVEKVVRFAKQTISEREGQNTFRKTCGGYTIECQHKNSPHDPVTVRITREPNQETLTAVVEPGRIRSFLGVNNLLITISHPGPPENLP